MCSVDDPPASAVVAEARSYKQASLANPDGVQYMDHLWQMIEDIDQPLTVAFRTDQDIFEDVSVKAFWMFKPAEEDYRRATSQLVFDLPDEVCRKIQSRHAQNVRTRYFGDNTRVDLPEVIRSSEKRDGVRDHPFYGYREVPVITIQDDWPTLKEAIRLTALDSAGYLGGQSVKLNSEMESTALARINDRHLELLITAQLVARINRNWNKEFGTLLGVNNKYF